MVPSDGGVDALEGVEQIETWIRAAARASRYQEALSWLRALRAVDGRLSDEMTRIHARCAAEVADRAVAHQRPHGGRLRLIVLPDPLPDG